MACRPLTLGREEVDVALGGPNDAPVLAFSRFDDLADLIHDTENLDVKSSVRFHENHNLSDGRAS
jgi:hypothetical protein